MNQTGIVIFSVTLAVSLLGIGFAMGLAIASHPRSFILRSIVRRVNEGDQRLWDILSALRGPDANPFTEGVSPVDIKAATTAVIRKRLGFNGYKVPFTVESDDTDKVKLRQDCEGVCGNHFTKHAQMAFYYLGLKWDEVNEG